MTLFEEYAAAGWKLCLITPGHKAPLYDNWQTKPVDADILSEIPGAGLLHALSGTCALDVDSLEAARPWLAAKGIDLDALLTAQDAVRIDSGRPGRAKLLYRMKRPLRTLRPRGSGLELRCATAEGTSAQDVLPPTIHKDTGKPYEWAYGEPLLGHWSALPPIPTGLLTLWRELAGSDEATPLPAPDKAAAPKTALTAELEKLRKAAFKHDPNCEMDEWLKVGMQLHDATGGAQEGLDIWDEWSRQATRTRPGTTEKVYPGKVGLKTRYLSFKSAPGKRVTTGEALIAELPAEADEFPDEKPAPAEVVQVPGKRRGAVADLVKRFVFVTFNEEYFDTERNAPIGFIAIKHLMTPLMPLSHGREQDPVDLLMRAPKKLSVEALAFHPGAEAIFTHEGKEYANTFYAKSMPEPIEPMADELEKINWLFARIKDDFFRGWLLQFYAHMVQHPATKIRTAPLMWSKTQGNGKSTLMHTIPKRLAGDQYYIGVDKARLESGFNDYLIGKWIVALTEFRGGTRGERGEITKRVEEWIADDVLNLSIKNGRGCSVPNHLVFTASTNQEDAAQIDPDNRKWAVHELDAPKMTPTEKTWLFEEFLNTPRARAVLRHYFLNYPITTFNPNEDAPMTTARQDMVQASMTREMEILLTAFEEHSEPLHRDVVLTKDVGDYVRRHSASKPSDDKIGKILCGEPFNGKSIKFRCGPGTYRAVVLRGNWDWATGKQLMEQIQGDDVDLNS